jgi:hypothetical protein
MTSRRFGDQKGWIEIFNAYANVLWAAKHALVLKLIELILELNKLVAGVLR